MEERLIDDQVGRKVRMKKTEEGYIDVTDEMLEEESYEDEISFELPMLSEDKDDEDLVGLSPQEAAELLRQKAAAEQARKDEYERLCTEGDKLLETGSFKAAELKFERALSMDEKATAATVGYWRAKTNDFEEMEGLVGEYAEEGVENLEFDLGYEAIALLKENFRDKFSAGYKKVKAEEETLYAKVKEGQDRRRSLLKTRRKNWAIPFAVGCVVTVALIVALIIFGMKNFTVSDDRYVLPTIVLGVVFVVEFIAFGVVTNKFVNACRICSANERLSATEDGARVEALRQQMEIYEYLLA